jgi:hypothetical protein
MRWKRIRRDDRRTRLADDVRRTAGLMAAVIADAERLKLPSLHWPRAAFAYGRSVKLLRGENLE